ncbi:hypothetical protein [Streptomyces sp. 6N223]|uniref:hypothetical protein n=1 Tax=Streptomyces sp. 6N223 TaxID=3457412 RepID=UPI003FCFEDFF
MNSGDWLVPDDEVDRLGTRHAPRRIVEGRSVAARGGVTMVTPVAARPARETIRSRRTERGWAGAKKSFRQHWQLYLFMVPSLVYFAVFKYIPMANNVIAFKNYTRGGPVPDTPRSGVADSGRVASRWRDCGA